MGLQRLARKIRRGLVGLLVAALFCACGGQGATVKQPGGEPFHVTTPAGEQANIVFILTDDQDSPTLAYMPELNRLVAQQGVSLSNYLVNVSLCCPSRASTLLGQYAQNSQIMTNGGKKGGFKTFVALGCEEQTIAVALQQAGYRTAFFGKYLNGYPGNAGQEYVPPGWSEWYSPAGGRPYSNFKYRLNENGQVKVYGEALEDYLTDVLAAKAVDFIQRAAAGKQPFFVFMSTYAPHTPFTPAPRHTDLFNDLKAPRTQSYNETDVSDKPAYIQELKPLPYEAVQRMDEQYVLRLQSLQAVDEMVAALVGALEQSGELENTYIFYASDNGFHLGQHRLRTGKQTPYEEDVRVPLLVRGPGLPPGQSRDGLAGNIDLGPTFAEIAGIDWSGTDGRSLLPLLAQPGQPSGWRAAYLLQNWETTGEDDEAEAAWLPAAVLFNSVLEPPDGVWNDDLFAPLAKLNLPQFRALRTAEYTYVEYQTGEIELYDLRADPDQLNNLAAIANPALLQALADWLARLSVCKGATCRDVDQAPASLPAP
jgi:N-acetylglucosamine-6-sulfatase